MLMWPHLCRLSKYNLKELGAPITLQSLVYICYHFSVIEVLLKLTDLSVEWSKILTMEEYKDVNIVWQVEREKENENIFFAENQLLDD